MSVNRIMDANSADVAVEAMATTSFCTYSDIELIHKRYLKAEGVAAVRNFLLQLNVSKNESRKRDAT